MQFPKSGSGNPGKFRIKFKVNPNILRNLKHPNN